MNRFISAKRHSGMFRQLLAAVVLFLCCLLLFLHGVSALSSAADETYTASLQQAILRSAVHCYATEGRYPESIDYLKEHYGIRWDETKYLVDYEIIAANLRPDVTVILLHPKEDDH